MLIDWPRFIAALVLLLTPVAIFHNRKVRYRPISRDWTDHWAQVFSLGLHWFDLLRAAAGMWLLADALHLAPNVRGLVRYEVVLFQGAVVAAAVTLQTVICKEPDSANAPFAFVAGLVLGFVPPVIASFALMISVVVAGGLRSSAAFFPFLALSVPGMGALFTGKKHLLILIITACAALLPWLISLLFSRELVASYQARRHDDSRGPVPHSPLR